MTPSLRRRLLIHLADEGAVEDPAGRVTTLLAEVLGTGPSYIGTILARAEADGLLVRDHNRGRTFRVLLTEQGRAEIARDGHARVVIPRRRVVAQPAPMPVLGPISRVRFDPEMARDASFQYEAPDDVECAADGCEGIASSEYPYCTDACAEGLCPNCGQPRTSMECLPTECKP